MEVVIENRLMNRAQFLLAILLAASMANQGWAQTTTVASSQAQAIKQWPALGTPDSRLNKRSLEIHALAEKMKDPLLRDPDWPMKLAKFVSLEIHRGSDYTRVPEQSVFIAGTVTQAANDGVVIRVDDGPQFANVKLAAGTRFIFVRGSFTVVNGRVVQYGDHLRAEANLVDNGFFERLLIDSAGKSIEVGKGTSLPVYSTVEKFITDPTWGGRGNSSHQ